MPQNRPGSFEPPQTAFTAVWFSPGGISRRESVNSSRLAKFSLSVATQRQIAPSSLMICLARPRYCSSSHAPNCMCPRHH